MRENLLKKQPTWGLRRAQGTGQKSATPATLTKVILVLLTMFLLPSAAWGQETITVAGNAPESDGTFIDKTSSKPISGVTFYSQTNTLTLDNATLGTGTDSDPCVILSSLENLTINLVGENTLYGYILKPNNLDNSESYSLAFSGDGSLAINSKEDWTYPIKGFATVNLNGFCIASTDRYGVFWDREDNRFEGYNGVDYVKEFYNMTVTKNAYPIWVYYSGGYIQLTPTNNTINQPGSTGTISYDGATSTLTLSSCNYSTGESLYAFCIGEGLDQNTLNVFLEGQNTIESKSDCFMIPLASPNGTATLNFSTNETTPGSLEISTNSYGAITHSGVTVLCNNNLRYNGNKVATNLAQLMIGDTEITGDVSTLDGYPGVSFDATNNILTLSSATIGASIISYIDDLTINLEGTNTISGGISILKTAIGSLKFTGSNDCSLTINNAGSSSSGAAIYNFTSVDFGSFNLSSSTSPAVYYKTDKDDPNSYQTWTNHIGGGGFTVSNITLTTKTVYPLWVGRNKSSYVQITEDNKTNVLGDSKISFDGTQTLTLSEAVLSGNIISGLNALTIIIDKANTININDTISCIRNIAPDATLTLMKSNSETSSLSLEDEAYIIKDFSSISYSEGGLYLSAYSKVEKEGQYVDVLVPDAYFSYKGLQKAYRAVFTTESLDYLLKIGDTSINESVTINSGDYENVIAGSITFSIDENNNGILTLDNVRLSNDVNNKILSYLPSLTINIKGSCEIGEVISTYSNATLTLGLAEGANDESKLMTQIGDQKPFWEGFAGTPTFNDNLCFLPNDDSEVVEKLPTPHLSIVDGGLQINLSGSNLDQMHKFYSVDFVEGNDVELKEYNSDSPETIDKPCTVTAYTEFEDVFGVKRQSETVTGKYFGIADKTIVFNNETKGTELKIDDLEIIPASQQTKERVSFSFRGVDNSDVIMPSQEGNGYKLSIAGIGRCEVSMEIDDDNATIQVLNPFESSVSEVKYAKGVVTVVPPAPSFSIEEKEEYLNTDKVELIMPEEMDEDQNASIRYSWVETEVDGTEYNSDSKVQLNAGTGTLYAWVRYSQTDADPILSEKVSMTFENVKINIDQFSVKNMLEESPVYQGSAISVPFTLYDPKVETTTISAENYDVIYKKYVGGDEGYETVESVVDVGTYIVSIKGKGSYGGEKLIYENLVVTQASLEDAAISKLIVGDKEYTYDGKDIEIPYTGEAIQPEVVVIFNDGTVDASEYTVSYGENNTEISTTPLASVIVTSTNNNFEEGTFKSLNFKIVPAPVTITAEAQTVTYNAQQQAYTGASADNENVTLAIAYYPSEEERTTGSNALAGAPTDAGTYYVSVTLNEESLQHYTAEPANVKFTIAQLDIEDAVITLDKEELTYNGKGQSVTVEKVMVGDIEVAADYYEISGNSGIEAGNYTLIVTAKTVSNGSPFKNNFTGNAEKAWKINHRTASAEDLGFKSETQTASTYYNSDEDFNLPEGYVAYIITGINGNSVTTQRVSYIPKDVAVLVEKGQSSESPNDATPSSTLPLKGTQEGVDVTSITGGTVYVLYNGEFVKSTSGTIPAHRCYLLIPDQIASGTRSFGIDHGDGTTSLREVKGEKWADGEWYTLQGQRIAKPAKGLYILNGKKVVIK